ncbi:PmoA family protein [Aureibaculum sp. 2210JD6-5]|uniref:DUF6807 domain-containing protein n=1 Tax=Aureibaculum sp. 2210JD6-5 TaxID=3103957 RepID=UPI002AAE76FE|nr:PmoA family protein [Aureibaculum sp. 2210JD6-5]MDY7395482.1 PmoA family protein [Aureibaculum sp. 2210JD6-5]
MKHVIYTLTVLFYSFLPGQEILKFQVESGNYNRMDCPVALTSLPDGVLNAIDNLQLVEITNNGIKPMVSQINKNSGELGFILKGFTPKNATREFQLVTKKIDTQVSQINLLLKDGAIQLSYKKRPILNYRYETVYPPKGVDSLFKKSGFIHPLWTPEGEVLTRIQPPDHYHHYGIWGPWTKTKIDNRQVDFWNLGEGQGTVLFKKFTQKEQGNVYSSFTALQEHIDFGAKNENRNAINENLEIRAWNLGDNKPWLVDYTSEITSPLENGILFEAYRYGGGIGFRATEIWNKDNTSVLTSENKDRITADGSSARWSIIEGATNTKTGNGGILFMSHKENKHFPEPMRVWPMDANGGRGDMFFEFCPIRHKPWQIESDKAYKLKYRMLIFDGSLSAEQAEMAWQGFANPPKVIIKNN